MCDSQAHPLAVTERIIGEEIGANRLPIEQQRLWQEGKVEQCLDQMIRKCRRGTTLYILTLALFWLIPLLGLLWGVEGPPVLYSAALAGLMTVLQPTQVFAFFLPRQWRLEQLQLQYRIAKATAA